MKPLSFQSCALARFIAFAISGSLQAAVQPDNVPPASRVSRQGSVAGQGSKTDDGYRGIWFALGQRSEFGDKYSGGLGTYTANHIPLAIYAPEVDKTFFVYGGTRKGERHLLAMASFYDHKTGRVPRPTIVHDKDGVNDPHDNPSLAIDGRGYLWVFISGRGRARPGLIYRSKEPFSTAAFEFIRQEEFTYPQPRFVPGQGFFFLFTKYTAGRELYWATSQDGVNWGEHRKLAGLEGHYQVSNVRDGKIATFFNRHPGGSVDRRTDLYYLQTTSWGQTWTTADGGRVEVPLSQPANPARVIDYAAQRKLVYTIDLNFDQQGNPVLLYIVSSNYQAGPAAGPREWTLTRWTGMVWETHLVCTSDHNYDCGSLLTGEGDWKVIGPTEPGPQPNGTGGDLALWVSADQGRTWTKKRTVTHGSELNHSYVRRPVGAKDPFALFWADGDPNKQSPSQLYFGTSNGERYWQLPYGMSGTWATPREMRNSP
jgi:hypothetical protein